MKRTFIATAILALSATTFTAPSNAAPIRADLNASNTALVQQVHHKQRRASRHRDEYRILPPRRIARKLHRQGYRNIQNIRLRRGEYRVRALGYRGPVKLIVNAHTGEVIYRKRIRRGGHHHNNHGRHFGGRHGGFSWSYSIR